MANLSSMLFFLLHLLLTLTLIQVYSYTPYYNLAINCGYSTGTIINASKSNNRPWLSDVDSNKKFFSFPTNENLSVKAEPHNYNPSLVDIPYNSARLSFSSFTYSFPIITTGPLFLRLHFYPTSYDNFEPSNALFSVEISSNKKKSVTLLKDFNPSVLWVTNEHEKTFVKEYCIQIEEGDDDDKRLNISFIPSANRSGIAYAFVNGIEVVSMPSFLYYTEVPSRNTIKLLGYDKTYDLENDKALEMVYRVNVGKRSVLNVNDAGGMFRYWENDYPYLKKVYPLSLPNPGIVDLHYSINVPNYTAPEDVYLSARTYGSKEVDNFNVTWSFEVDSGFSYMVRLHFCEIEYQYYTKLGDRVFQIFIANTMAEENADVIGWSGGILTPVYKDYVVLNFFASGVAKRNNLTIELQRAPLYIFSRNNGVILNGIEIFKISENDSLAGSNPEPRNLNQNQNNAKKKNSIITKVIVAVVAISTIVLASIIIVVITLRRRKSLNSNKEESSVLPTHLCRYFTIAEIKSATKNFDEVFIIGVGGFGNVYKGYIDGYTTPVAIKRLKAGSQQGVNEFLNEIELLSQLRHVHLVSLIGYCNDGEEMILVYDFMERGTLREYLYGSENEALSWKRRIEILLGAAKGLQYLHAGAKHNIIHRDVKSTNILLDEKWVAKVSDFGLSKVGPNENTSTTHISTLVKGSFGYLDPEYYLRQRLTLKSDVYSFGVVLLEVLCARPPMLRGNVDKKKTSLVGWFQKCHNELGDIEIKKIVDPFIRDCVSDESLTCYCHVALSCLLDDGNQRPTMNDVVGVLEFVLGLVVCEEESGVIGGAEKESDEGSNMRFTSSEESGSHTSKDSSTVSRSSEGPSLFSSNVFSEIGNPTAR